MIQLRHHIDDSHSNNVLYKYDNFSDTFRAIEDDIRWTSSFRQVKEHAQASFGKNLRNSAGHRLTGQWPVTGKKMVSNGLSLKGRIFRSEHRRDSIFFLKWS